MPDSASAHHADTTASQRAGQADRDNRGRKSRERRERPATTAASQTPASAEASESSPSPEETSPPRDALAMEDADFPGDQDIREEHDAPYDEALHEPDVHDGQDDHDGQGEPGDYIDEPLMEFVDSVVRRLLAPLMEAPSVSITMSGPGRVSAVIAEDEDSGLVIGREGSTIQAIEYLVGRIIAKQWPTPVRFRLDAGGYRERQNDSLRQLALDLAAKAKNQHKAQSTKPLSSYHRRVIHMTLQGDGAVDTRSAGEGPMKRVVIAPKDAKGGKRRPTARRRSGKRSRNGGGRSEASAALEAAGSGGFPKEDAGDS